MKPIFLALALCSTSAFAQQNTIWNYEYDANGNRTKVTDPLNKATVSQYNALNQLTKTTDPGNGQILYAYNGQGQLVQVTDPRSLVTSYSIDGLGKQTQQLSPDTGTSSATYDAAGNVLTRTDAKGQITTYTYDALNRITQITYHDGSKDLYTWDQGTAQKGRLTKIEQKNAANTTILTIQYSYDTQGRLLQESRTLGSTTHVIQYQYDAGSGFLTRLTYPSGRKIDYAYDNVGRISSLSLTDTNSQVTVLASSIQYHPFGGIKSMLNGAGQTLTFGQDLDGRTSSYILGNQLWQIGYDAASRIVTQMNTADVTQAASYNYDAVDRLTQATLPNNVHGYSYDATGNRTSQTVGVSTRTYAISPASNRLSSISGSDPRNYGYDANGSITGDSSQTYGYDVRGRMTSSTGALGSTTYHIDPLGQRIRKVTGSEDNVYHYDRSGHLISTTGFGGLAREDIVWLGDRPIAVIR